jgi:hypothetical protein
MRRDEFANRRFQLGDAAVHTVEMSRHSDVDRVQELPKLRRSMPLIISSLVFTLTAAKNVVVPCLAAHSHRSCRDSGGLRVAFERKR